MGLSVFPLAAKQRKGRSNVVRLELKRGFGEKEHLWGERGMRRGDHVRNLAALSKEGGGVKHNGIKGSALQLAGAGEGKGGEWGRNGWEI